jgi:hypothetical protein
MKRLLSILLIASALAVPSFAVTVTFHASISGDNEVPVRASPIWGVGNLELDTVTGEFHLVVNLKDADENLIGSHIHIGAAGVNGAVIVGLGNESAYRRVAGKNLHRVFTGVVPAEHIEAMLSNGTYLNFHTPTFPGGAARGQLIANPVELWAELSGANEVPVRVTPATGVASIIYNPGTKIISVHVEVIDFANQVTGSHIHTAAVGVNGGVTLGLGGESSYTRTPPLVGTSLEGNFIGLVYPGPSLPLLNGGTYINIHSTVYMGGEIRGQIYGN